jgi:hypothetical protein
MPPIATGLSGGEPPSGDILLATGASRWRTSLKLMSAVGATVGDCRRYAVLSRRTPHVRIYFDSLPSTPPSLRINATVLS